MCSLSGHLLKKENSSHKQKLIKVYLVWCNHCKLLVIDLSRGTNTPIISPLLSRTFCLFVFHFRCRSEGFFTAHLPAGNHPGHVNVVVCKHLFGFLDGGLWQGSRSPQDPGEVDVEEPEDVGAWIHQGRVHVVSRQDPVRGVGEDCSEDRSWESRGTNAVREGNTSNMCIIKAHKLTTLPVNSPKQPTTQPLIPTAVTRCCSP